MSDWQITVGHRWIVVATVLAAVTGGLWLGRGQAADAACIVPTVEPAVGAVPAGSHLRVTGEHWLTCVDVSPSDDEPVPYEQIRILLVRQGDQHELARVDADESGRIDATVDVPAGLDGGAYQLLGRTADEAAGSSPHPVQVTSGVRTTSRVGGADRVETAVLVSQRNFPDGAATVYLARSDVPFDAMVGATATDGPILLVPGCDLPDAVAAEIMRVDPAEVVALGGPGALCPAALDEAGRGTTVDR